MPTFRSLNFDHNGGGLSQILYTLRRRIKPNLFRNRRNNVGFFCSEGTEDLLNLISIHENSLEKNFRLDRDWSIALVSRRGFRRKSDFSREINPPFGGGKASEGTLRFMGGGVDSTTFSGSTSEWSDKFLNEDTETISGRRFTLVPLLRGSLGKGIYLPKPLLIVRIPEDTTSPVVYAMTSPMLRVNRLKEEE